MNRKSQVTQNDFVNPPEEFRSVPFWSLNDWLEPEEIKKQIREFKEGGFGGVYLHSRTGLLTGFLDDDWWKAMEVAVDACLETGMDAWFYDEDKWPSGYAGGLVPLKSEAYHIRYLVRLTREQLTFELPHGSEIIAEDKDYYYMVYKDQMGSPWFNGTCWVDLMNPEVVREFINEGYRPYAERFKSHVGNTVKGIFTDEAQVGVRYVPFKHSGAISYSPVMRAKFIEQHGYDFVDHIASLFENTGEYRKIRLDYYRTIARQFEESFSKQIGKYCKENKLIWTGHLKGEDSLGSIIFETGNMMINYRHMQRPGMDHLCLKIEQYILTAKSVSSIANQYGLSRRLSELFGASGQNLNFEDRKWIADWHAVLGINHFCPHLALYSMKGCRKRDFPPTLSPQQPYWKYNKVVEDYISRVCMLASWGRFAAEVLVLHPLESAYMEYRNRDSQEVMKLNQDFYNVMETLLSEHRDFDLGDEEVLRDTARIEGRKIVVGEMAYGVVVMPYMKTIRKETLELLLGFMAAGGKVIAVGNYPEYIDAVSGEAELQKLHNLAKLTDLNQLAAELEAVIPAAVKLTGAGNEAVYTQRRIVDVDITTASKKAGTVLQFTNTSRMQTCYATIHISESIENPVLWEPTNGKCYRLKTQADGSFQLRLSPAQTLFITSGMCSEGLQISGDYKIYKEEAIVASLEGKWKGKRLDPNAITLDYARYSTDGGISFSLPEPIIGIHERLGDQNYRGELQLAFEFEVDQCPAQCSLVLEQPEMYKAIEINGQPVSFKNSGYYRDKTFRTAQIVNGISTGLNRILLTLDYIPPIPDSRNAVERYGTEIESIYLIGDFGVEAIASSQPPVQSQRNLTGFLPQKPVNRFSRFILTGEKDSLEGDLTKEGYPFYNGEFELVKEFELETVEADGSYFIQFPETEVTMIQCEINGVMVEPIAWSPWETNITSAVKAGRNTVKLILVNSLRNLLGPHHNPAGELFRIGPESFSGKSSWGQEGEPDWYDRRIAGKAIKWVEDYYMVPFGLLKAPAIVKRR